MFLQFEIIVCVCELPVSAGYAYLYRDIDVFLVDK